MRKLLLPIFALTLVLLVACGGGDKKDDGGNASTTSGGGGNSTSQTLDVARATEKLTNDVRSFRFDLKMKLNLGDITSQGGSLDDLNLEDLSDEDGFGAAFAQVFLSLLSDIQAQGSYANGDVDVTMKLLGKDVRYVQVGDKAWVNYDGTWEETDPGNTPIGDSPTDLLGEFVPQEVLNAAKVSKENVNGVSATRYSFDKNSLQDLAAKMGEESGGFDQVDTANLDVWLNGDGVPVKIAMNFAGKDENGQKVGLTLEMNIRDINSDSIKIKSPV